MQSAWHTWGELSFSPSHVPLSDEKRGDISLRRLLSVILTICFCLSLTSCSSDSDSYLVSYDLKADPINLDPQTAADQASLTVIHNIFEGLFTVNALGEPKNALAQSYELSPDGLRYLFTLRQDGKWTGTDENGTTVVRPVTAPDFVFAFRRLLRPDTRSPAASQYACIKNAAEVSAGTIPDTQLGVKALSDYQLEIELVDPNDNFLNLLAATYAMPCNEDFFLSTRGKYGLERSGIMSNGAFDLRSWKHGKQVKLVRNQNYYAVDQVLPAGVNLWITDSDVTEESRLLDGIIDAAFVPGENTADLSGEGFNMEPIENAVWGLYINQKNPTLANENIRKAIARAFDRSTYHDSLLTNQETAEALVPHGSVVFGSNFRKYAGDSLAPSFHSTLAYDYYMTGLKELGSSGTGGIQLLVNEESGAELVNYFQSASQILQKELSLFISIEKVTDKEYREKLRKGDFDIALYKMETADNTPWSILSRFQSGDSRNYISYQNEELDRLLARLSQQGSRAEVLAACKDAEAMILSDAVFIPMCYSTDYFVTRQKTTGIAYNPQTGLVSFRFAAKT